MLRFMVYLRVEKTADMAADDLFCAESPDAGLTAIVSLLSGRPSYTLAL
jgi:hypothetical protein